MNDTPTTIWTLPNGEPATGGPGRTEADIAAWRELTPRVRELAVQNNWSKAEVARRSNMPDGTFNQWFSGLYTGRLDTQNLKISQWLAAVEDMQAVAAGIPTSPGYFETRTSLEIEKALLFAQSTPDLSIITVAAGMGKTATGRQYCTRRPHAFLVTMSPNTATVYGMLTEIAFALGVTQTNPAKLHRAIGERLQRNGRQPLLVVDEAQNLQDQAINQLRTLLDLNGCGIALMGNNEVYARFQRKSDGPSNAQIRRRIGMRLQRLQPYPEDIAAQLDAWNIGDDGSRKFLTGIGHKPGSLGQIDKTLKLAGMLAGPGNAITEKLIRAAWANRNVEE